MFRQNTKNKLLIFFLSLSFLVMPGTIYAYSSKVIVGGENIGIEVKSKGVVIVGFYNVGNISPGKTAGLEIGDVITKIDDTAINKIADLTDIITTNKTAVTITYTRNDETYQSSLKLLKDSDNTYKTGLYVKDAILGIGTLTFIDPITKTFGALGHEITEKSTKRKFEINSGTIFKSHVTGVDKSMRNSPGEKNAKYFTNEVYGNITKNEINGIYGKYLAPIDNSRLLEIATSEEIKVGEATIRTVIDGSKIEEFKINIIKLSNNSAIKNILFVVTDKELLARTNGIVQGMSGSPIIQNNKIIGAITHVVIDNPHNGYGIFITNMLEETEN